MKNIFKKIGATVLAGLAVVTVATGLIAVPAHADCDDQGGLRGGVDCGKVDDSTPTNLFGREGVVTTVINTMLFIVGILAVIMIIYAGIRYVTAHGDKAQVQSASQTLIYAVVGLVVAILAYAIVNYVTTLFGQ